MENAVDALKIGFAVLVFTIALSLIIYMFTQARETADMVLHSSDITEYMQYLGFDNYKAATKSSERIVGLETIIPTLYKYYKENYTVIFRTSSGNFMELYKTKTNINFWSVGYTNKYYGNKSTKVCSFDVDEEIKRREPWTGSVEHYKKNLDAFLSGGKFKSPSGNGMNYDYSSNGFIKKYGNKKFIENLGEYEYDIDDTGLTKSKKKRVIIYTLQN